MTRAPAEATPTAPTAPADAPLPPLAPLIISAPFGNYVQPPGCTPTLGTFTALRRPGRVWRVLKTVRYYRRLGAWVNKIGLRNPGIDWLCARASAGRISVADKLVSIHGFSDADWSLLIDRAAGLAPAGIELNMSCPNVGEIDWPGDLFERALRSGSAVVVKLPPVNYAQMLDQALSAGVRCFHCCNTLPVPGGGLSGKPLKPVALACVREVARRAEGGGRRVLIIGGGGITTPGDIDDYALAGARRFAVGTRVMTPTALWSDRRVRPLLLAARARSGDGMASG